MLHVKFILRSTGLHRLADTCGFRSVRQMCEALGLERRDVYRAVDGDAHALRRVTAIIGTAAAAIAFSQPEPAPSTGSAGTNR